MCKNEKHINNFFKNFSESKDCNRTRGLKRYYKNKDEISSQQKRYYGKNNITETNKRCIQIRDLVVILC